MRVAMCFVVCLIACESKHTGAASTKAVDFDASEITKRLQGKWVTEYGKVKLDVKGATVRYDWAPMAGAGTLRIEPHNTLVIDMGVRQQRFAYRFVSDGMHLDLSKTQAVTDPRHFTITLAGSSLTWNGKTCQLQATEQKQTVIGNPSCRMENKAGGRQEFHFQTALGFQNNKGKLTISEWADEMLVLQDNLLFDKALFEPSTKLSKSK